MGQEFGHHQWTRLTISTSNSAGRRKRRGKGEATAEKVPAFKWLKEDNLTEEAEKKATQ